MTQRLQITAPRGRGACVNAWKWLGIAALFAGVSVPDRILAAADEPIGSWILSCRDQACVLRHKDRPFDAAGVLADLEVRAAGTLLVPAIAVRGVPNEVLLAAVTAGKVEVSMQLAKGPPIDLFCAVDTAGYLCAPRDEAVPALAAAFPSARSMTVRISLSIAGSNPLSVRDRSLALAGTRQALARLTAAGAPSVAPNGWLGLLDRGLKAVGYKGGLTDLPGVLDRYLGR
jgi:hypothetical protein